MPAVMSNKRPASLPISAMAGVTSPTIINGMRNCKKWLKMALNVADKRTPHVGTTLETAMPSTIAINMRSSKGTFSRVFIFTTDY